MKIAEIDHGGEFDWGRTSDDYAKYRDIYPAEFFHKLVECGLCIAGQEVLDLGTGTAVLPRMLHAHGARFTGLDIAPQQLAAAERLCAEAGVEITLVRSKAVEADFPPASFDAVTACQCFAYFDHARLAPRLHRWLKPGGRFAVLYMGWLTAEDPLARASEELVQKHNPLWNGAELPRHPVIIPPEYPKYFTVEHEMVFDMRVPFTREGWNGRIRSCRGIGASLPPDKVAAFDREHRALLERIAPESFTVAHYGAVTVFRARADVGD